MGPSVNLYELTHAFWKENRYDPFPLSAIALFFFLLDRANSQYWNMPIRCPTIQIGGALSVSEQTVLNSRSILSKRGIISYIVGHGNKVAPLYTIVTDPTKWAVRLGDKLTDDLGDRLRDSLVDNLNINKDINIKDKISSNNKEAKEEILSVERLEEIFLADGKWQADVISLMSQSRPLNTPELHRQISTFFQELKCKGITEREERDCRTHFINWLKKQPQNSNQNNSNNGLQKSNGSNARRSAPVTAQSANDYAGKLSNRAPAGTTKTLSS